MSAATICEDFKKLNESMKCPCPSDRLYHAIWEFKMVDVLKFARGFRDPVVFAVEYHQKGSRLFMVTSRSHAFHLLCHLRLNRPEHPTWHEIISGLTPQRLYFDLEFYKQSNPGLDTRYLLRHFQELITELLVQYFHWKEGEERNLRFLDLDASTGEKFSHHLIVRMRSNDGVEIIFKDVTEIQTFVNELVLPAMAERNRGGFYVQPKPGLSRNGENVPFIDTGVYKLKQNFRLLGSPKFDRQNVLRLLNTPDGRHHFDFHDPNCQQCYDTFGECLVTASTGLVRTGDPPNVKMVIEESALMTVDNLELYRKDIKSTAQSDILRDPSYEDFYCEIRQFEISSQWFEPKFRRVLLNDLVIAMKRSEFYDLFEPPMFPEDDDPLYVYSTPGSILDIFDTFKFIMNRDPVDWDAVHETAAELLMLFEDGPPNDDNHDGPTPEEMELRSKVNADSNTIRRLRKVYRQLDQWQKQSPDSFFAQDYARAKGLYDSCMVQLLSTGRSTIPTDYPRYLSRDNFRHVFDLLQNLERWESERLALRKSRVERNAAERIEKLRRRLEEERNYLMELEECNGGSHQDSDIESSHSDSEDIDNTSQPDSDMDSSSHSDAKNDKRMRYAIEHATHLVQDYERRFNEAKAGKKTFVLAIMAVEKSDQESD